MLSPLACTSRLGKCLLQIPSLLLLLLLLVLLGLPLLASSSSAAAAAPGSGVGDLSDGLFCKDADQCIQIPLNAL